MVHGYIICVNGAISTFSAKQAGHHCLTQMRKRLMLDDKEVLIVIECIEGSMLPEANGATATFYPPEEELDMPVLDSSDTVTVLLGNTKKAMAQEMPESTTRH